jgi:GNAT superfamily N-acetyltransferase
MQLTQATEHDLEQLLPLIRSYCGFYKATPTDEDLLALCRTLIADPEREGLQLLARDPAGCATGFATLYWTGSTTTASRIGVRNDLFVAEDARGYGIAEALIDARRAACATRGASRLTWQTAPRQRARPGRLRQSRGYPGAMDRLLAAGQPIAALHAGYGASICGSARVGSCSWTNPGAYTAVVPGIAIAAKQVSGYMLGRTPVFARTGAAAPLAADASVHMQRAPPARF